MSQSEFAEALGVSRGHISNIENGKAEPAISMLWEIEKKFFATAGSSIHSLLFGEDHFQGEANEGAVWRHATVDLRALGAALKRADEMERASEQPTAPPIKTMLVRSLMQGYVERYQRMKLAGATPDECHAAAEEEVASAGRGVAAE